MSGYPALFAELAGRGWSDADCAALASSNILRVRRETESAAAAVSATRPPATERIEDFGTA